MGFAFCNRAVCVALIRKARPEWQRGRVNGIGGKVGPGETPLEAMRREFREKAGVDVADWEQFLTLDYPNATVHFFRCFGRAYEGKTATDEPVLLCYVRRPPHNLIPNLRWILPLALETFRAPARMQLGHDGAGS